MLKITAAFMMLVCGGALAQPVQQSGTVTPHHATTWTTDGVVQDGGTSAGAANSSGNYLNTLGITNGGTPFCVSDAFIGAMGGYHQLCLGANVLGGGLLSYQAYGGAAPLPLTVNVNGVNYPLTFPPVNGLPEVPNNAALKALPIASATLVYRAGFTTPGDGGAVFYTFSSSPCSLFAAAGDNGSQVAPNVGTGCWIANFSSDGADVRAFGAVAALTTDSTTAIQNTINAVEVANPKSGGVVKFTPGDYHITGTLNVGNGNGSTPSTTAGVKLVCVGAFSGAGSNNSTCNIQSSVAGPAVEINGPIQGSGIENLGLVAASGNTSTSAIGLLVNSGQWGKVDGLVVAGFYGDQIRVTTTGSAAGFQNTFRQISLFLPAGGATARGLVLNGNGATADVFTDSFYDTDIQTANAGHTSIYIGSADSERFYNTSITNATTGTKAIVFDYNQSSNGWPVAIGFWGLETANANPGSITNVGIPSLIDGNKIYSFSTINGATVPFIANLLIADANPWVTWTPVISCGTGTLTTLGAVTARYTLSGKTITFNLHIPITTNGSCAGSVMFTLPFSVLVTSIVVGREATVSNKIGSAVLFSGSGSYVNYDNTYPGANGADIFVSGSYETVPP